MKEGLDRRFLRRGINPACEEFVFNFLITQIFPIKHRQQRSALTRDEVIFSKCTKTAAAGLYKEGGFVDFGGSVTLPQDCLLYTSMRASWKKDCARPAAAIFANGRSSA